jgi:hypothetical protein
MKANTEISDPLRRWSQRRNGTVLQGRTVRVHLVRLTAQDSGTSTSTTFQSMIDT